MKRKQVLSYLARNLGRDFIYMRSTPDHKTGCWNWTRAKDSKGYGRLRIKRGGVQLDLSAHRLSWMVFNEKRIKGGKVVMHSCDNPMCVNPDHLSLGTMMDNSHDMIAKGRDRFCVPHKKRRKT